MVSVALNHVIKLVPVWQLSVWERFKMSGHFKGMGKTMPMEGATFFGKMQIYEIVTILYIQISVTALSSTNN